MVPKISHNYKKSMINPKQLKPGLEIQLPDLEAEILRKQYASTIKKESTPNKTAAFLPNQMISPTV